MRRFILISRYTRIIWSYSPKWVQKSRTTWALARTMGKNPSVRKFNVEAWLTRGVYKDEKFLLARQIQWNGEYINKQI